MDKEQEELQFIGFFGIWRESLKIISTCREIFLQLSLVLILPLCFIYFAHAEINHLLAQSMVRTIVAVAITSGDATANELASRALSRELARYLLVQVTYIVFLLVFSLLSTSAVVYTVACIYTGKKSTFKEVMCVVPKVWKRLMVTFLCVMTILFIYNFVIFFIIFLIILAYPISPNNMGKYMLPGAIAGVLYLTGVCYMGVVWQLANTISVLEESTYGFQALRKSKYLMKGKMGISVSIFLVINLCVGGALHMYNRYVVFDHLNLGMFRWEFGVISLSLFCIITLLGLVVHTVFYLVCKSYHHEQIDKSALADHLEVYHGEGYVLLKPKDIQLMEQV